MEEKVLREADEVNNKASRSAAECAMHLLEVESSTMGRGDRGTWKVLMQPPMAGAMIPTAAFGFFQQFKINYLYDGRCITAVCGLLRPTTVSRSVLQHNIPGSASKARTTT